MEERIVGGTAYCTIASANYLAKVQALMSSLERHQPLVQIEVLLCETPEVCRRISAETKRAFRSPEDVCPNWREMSFYYGVIEFNTALKPFLMEWLIERGFSSVIYFDPDIEIYSSLESIERLMQDFDVILTPHASKPVPQDGKRPAMDDYIRAGQFNLGFIGMAGTENGRSMLRWWQKVCGDRCLFDPSHRFFVDQFWAAAFASFAERCCVLRDPGCNVAYWNIFQRDLTRVAGHWLVDGKPLRFFHFSGLSEGDLTKVSRYQDRVQALPGSLLLELLEGYTERVAEMPWQMYASTPYSFQRYSDGHEISAEDRRNYLFLSPAERIDIGNPFDARQAVQRIVKIELTREPNAYLTRVKWERYARKLAATWSEFRHKLRTRGALATGRLIVRFILRKTVGNRPP